MSTKKRWVIIVIVIVLLSAAILWLIGNISQNKKEKEDFKYYSDLIEKDRDLQTLVNQNLQMKGVLVDTSDSDISGSYTLADINIIETIGKSELQEYGLAIGKALKPYSQPRESELLLTLEILETKNPTAQAKLDKILEMHQKSIVNFLAIPVPKNAQVTHLRLVNSMNNMATSLKRMTKILTDPELALQSSGQYIKDFAFFLRAVEGVNIYFTDQGITFPTKDITNIYDSLGIISEN